MVQFSSKRLQPAVYWFLLAILLLGAAFRFSMLSSIPGALSEDEASTGYDAFSILKTGRCQYGEHLPVFARSFGDYEEALYRYFTVPSIAVFGLNEFGTRFPAAVIGLLTILLMFWLTRELTGDGRLALLAALLLAPSARGTFSSAGWPGEQS